MKILVALWFATLMAIPSVFGQEVPPAFERGEKQGAAGGEAEHDPFDPILHAPKLVRVQVEYIEISHKDLTRLMMAEKVEKADATELRNKLQEMVEKDEAKIIDTQIVVGRSGQKQTTASIHEFIYPTEYDPPGFDAEEFKKMMEEGKFPVTPGNPTAFETRNVGSTLETEPTIGEDNRTVDLRFVPEIQWHTGDRVWSEYKDELGNIIRVSMPDFYKLSLNTSITCLTGQYTMVGAVSPKDAEGEVDNDRKVMIFVKCDVLPVIP